jgi:biopolymer transport protein ExbD
MRFQEEKRKRTIINITPLIDVVLLLLIFFMVSTHFIEQPGIKLDLPGTTSTEAEPVKDAVLAITADGSYYLDDQEIPISALRERLETHIQKSVDKKLTIKADQTVSHGDVVEVMDIAKAVGVEKLVVATKVRKE